MRVLFLLRKINCNDGIASYCKTLAGGLTSVGVPVDLACRRIIYSPSEEDRWEALQQSLTSWELLPRLRKLPDPVTFLAVRRYIRTRGITVINLHGLGMLVWAKLLSLTMRLPVVITYHPSVHGQPDEVAQLAQRPLTFGERFVLRWCIPDRLVVLSEESAEYLIHECPQVRRRIVTINGAVDDSYFRPPSPSERAAARERLSLEEGALAVLHVGRLSWNKGHDVLIDAVRRVRDGSAGSGVRCFFVGSGADEAEIKERALQQDQDRDTFTFLGFVKDLREVMWAADVFALPSRLEGFGLAVVEAMSCGLVAVRTPSGGARNQIIDGETGFVVPFDDSERLAEAITALSDPERRLAMRRRSIALAEERFTRAALTRAFTELYEQLSRRRPSRIGR